MNATSQSSLYYYLRTFDTESDEIALIPSTEQSSFSNFLQTIIGESNISDIKPLKLSRDFLLIQVQLFFSNLLGWSSGLCNILLSAVHLIRTEPPDDIQQLFHDPDEFVTRANRFLYLFGIAHHLDFCSALVISEISTLTCYFSSFTFIYDDLQQYFDRYDQILEESFQSFWDFTNFLLKPDIPFVELVLQKYKKLPSKSYGDDMWSDEEKIICSGCKTDTPKKLDSCVNCGNKLF